MGFGIRFQQIADKSGVHGVIASIRSDTHRMAFEIAIKRPDEVFAKAIRLPSAFVDCAADAPAILHDVRGNLESTKLVKDCFSRFQPVVERQIGILVRDNSKLMEDFDAEL